MFPAFQRIFSSTISVERRRFIEDREHNKSTRKSFGMQGTTSETPTLDLKMLYQGFHLRPEAGRFVRSFVIQRPVL